jgi:hypothetical protein
LSDVNYGGLENLSHPEKINITNFIALPEVLEGKRKRQPPIE